MPVQRPLWRIARFAAGLAAAGALCGAANAQSANPTSVTCAQADIRIVFTEPGRTDLICNAARAAIGFLASIGVPQRAPVTVRVVDAIPGGYNGAIGCYDWTDESVYIRGSAALIGKAAAPRPFGVEDNAALYESFVAHEVAHAVSAASFRAAPAPIVAQEYIAGVVQFAVMAAGERQRILAHTKGDGFDEPADINLLAYQLDPSRFAVEAYRHFVKQGDHGADFVQALLAGTIHLQDYVPIY